MPPKGKKDSQKDEEQREPLQAVLLTDSYQNRFAPFTLERPRCLLPLSNTPLIEYTLEFLAGSGVEEIYVYCGNHQDQIEEYLSTSKWMSDTSPFLSFQIIRSTATSIGDAMRDLDKREILKNDFLVLYGDMVSNFPLGPALEAHKKRRLEDKNCIMTMILRRSHTMDDAKYYDTPVFVCNPRQNRCLHYETIRANSDDRTLILDDETLKEPELELRSDLSDCGIDICTPDVLALWSDNFDFQTPRDNFLYSVLKDYELHGKKIFTHVIDDYYVKRVENLRQYAIITKDIIGRWAYPYCPDTNLLQNQNYQLKRNQVYLDQNLNLARSCNIAAKSVVGANCRIGKNTKIINSVIGSNCRIGDNVVIENSFIWSHAIIGSGSKIQRSIVAEGSTIGEQCVLEPGALISFNVVVAKGITVQGTSKITRMRRKSDSEDLELVENDTKLVGEKGTGAQFTPFEDDEDEDPQSNNLNNLFTPDLLSKLSALNISSDSISQFSDYSDSETSSLNASHIQTSNRDRSTASSFISIESAATGDSDDEDPASTAATARAAHDFHHEASSSLLEALQRNSPPETVLLEMNGLRLSTNASAHSVRRAVTHAFTKHILALLHSGQGAKGAIEGCVTPHADLWRRTVFDRDDDEKGDQVDLLLCVQSELKSKKEGDTVLFHLLQVLVQLDVVEAEGVEQWWGSEKSSSGIEMVNVRAKSKAIVDFLIADDDDSEEESSEEE